MHSSPFIRILVVQGSLLIINALSAYSVIGIKARNMMFVGLAVGLALWVCGYICSKNRAAIWGGLGISMAGLVIFTQRTSANFLSLIGIVQHEMNLDAYNKCIMVVLYMMMSVSCLAGSMMLYTYLPEKKS